MSTPTKEKPKSLQELISANALIDAFMGGGVHTPRPQHPEEKVEALLASIESCDDIETLVENVQSDMKVVNSNNVMTDKDNSGVGSDTAPGSGNAIQLDTLAASLSRIKSLLYNERTSSSSFELGSFFGQSSQFKTCASALLHALLLDDDRKMLFPALLSNLNHIPFEARKDVASIFNYLLVCGCVYNVGGGGCVVNEVQMEGSSEATTASYTKTMLGFVQYIYEYYEHVMIPLVDGHYSIHATNKSAVKNVNSNSAENESNPNETTEEAKADEKHQQHTQEQQAKQNQKQLSTVDVALLCGSMYRSTLRHPKLYAKLVMEENSIKSFVYPFLDSFANQPNFEVSSDGLETLRLILNPNSGGIAVPTLSVASVSPNANTDGNDESIPSTSSTITNPSELELLMEGLASSFLDANFESIFMRRFNVNMLNSQHANYITRRVSLQILSTILLTRTNYKVMMKYISNRNNLITIMMLLRDSSAHITLEAFNVFKIFVANPNKPAEILRILADNKVKLVKYLTGLHQEKEANDEQFRDEKALVISTLEQL